MKLNYTDPKIYTQKHGWSPKGPPEVPHKLSDCLPSSVKLLKPCRPLDPLDFFLSVYEDRKFHLNAGFIIILRFVSIIVFRHLVQESLPLFLV